MIVVATSTERVVSNTLTMITALQAIDTSSRALGAFIYTSPTRCLPSGPPLPVGEAVTRVGRILPGEAVWVDLGRSAPKAASKAVYHWQHRDRGQVEGRHSRNVMGSERG
jgi:hypothetical protein